MTLLYILNSEYSAHNKCLINVKLMLKFPECMESLLGYLRST